jgi:hypothetical protein
MAEQLHPAFERLLAQPPVTGGVTPRYGGALKGVYLFSERGSHLYVGRSNRLLSRYKNHWMLRKSHREAAFAFRLAREVTGRSRATYREGDGSRSDLVQDANFSLAFTTAKARIREMDYRWVEAVDPVIQCLLEIYAAVALETPYNDFDNH